MTESTTSSTSPVMPAIDLSDEGGIGGWEWVLIGAMTVAAVFYLRRKLGFGAGRSSGCSTCGKAGQCAPHAPKPHP